ALLAVGELVARAVHPPPSCFCVWEPGLELELHPRPAIMPGVAGPTRVRIDSLGLRGDEPPSGEAVHVLCVGGSTTECLYLDQDETWPALLQARLSAVRPTWVANAGRSGHSTREHVVHVEELLECSTHFDVVVLMAGVNDLGKRLSRDDNYDADFMA